MTTRKWLQDLLYSGLSEESGVTSSGLLSILEKEDHLEEFVSTPVGERCPVWPLWVFAVDCLPGVEINAKAVH